MSRYAITGIGIVDTLGNDPQQCWENYINKDHFPVPVKESHPGVDGVKCFYADWELDRPEGVRGPTYGSLEKNNLLALHAVNRAVKDAPQTNNVGVVFTSLSAEEPTKMQFASWLLGMGRRLRPKQQLQHLQSYTSSLISQVWDFNGGSLTVGAACATTLYALDLGMKMLDDDDLDYVVVGGAESSNHIWGLTYFNSLGALGSHSAPFDKGRDGFIMGEGSGALVVEKEEVAVARGAKIYGYIHRVGKSNDGARSNPTAPDPLGTGIKLSMMRAMMKSDIGPDQIAFVNAHATSTPAGDDCEYNAIQDLYPEVPVTSFKSKIGHTLGSSGIIETIYTLMALQNSTVPPNHNIKNCVHKHVPTEAQPTNRNFALKNGLAFGGKNATVLLEKGPDKL